MQIDNEQQYQDAMTELKVLEEAPAGDEAVQQRRRKRPPRNIPNS